MSLATNITNLATSIASAIKTTRGTIGSLSSLATTAKTSTVDAINEVRALVLGLVDDTSTGAGKTWSASKITQAIANAKSELLGGAGADYDTLKELQDGLLADQTAVGSINSALGNRVRVDASQVLTGTQQLQARTNIAAAGTADVGDTTTNFVTTFEQGLA